jgi:hypothetical protein
MFWIPTSVRLPNVGEDVLFSVADMYVAEGCLREDGDWFQFRWSAIRKANEVIAWSPLPKPYTADAPQTEDYDFRDEQEYNDRWQTDCGWK